MPDLSPFKWQDITDVKPIICSHQIWYQASDPYITDLWFLGGFISNQECSFFHLPNLALGLLQLPDKIIQGTMSARAERKDTLILPDTVFNIRKQGVSRSRHVFRKMIQTAILITGYEDLLSGNIIILCIVFHYMFPFLISILFWYEIHITLYPIFPAFFPVYCLDWKDTLNDDMKRLLRKGWV